jgi:hypothetical protein
MHIHTYLGSIKTYLQRAYHAEQESGSSEAPIKNKTAYYERVMEILRKAINYNQSNVDLQIKKLVLMEGQYGANYSEVKNEYDRVSNGQKYCKFNLHFSHSCKMCLLTAAKYGNLA